MIGEKLYRGITGAGAAGMLGCLALSLVPSLGITRIIRMLSAAPQAVAAFRSATNLLQRKPENNTKNPAPSRPVVQRGCVAFEEQS